MSAAAAVCRHLTLPPGLSGPVRWHACRPMIEAAFSEATTVVYLGYAQRLIADLVPPEDAAVLLECQHEVLLAWRTTQLAAVREWLETLGDDD